MASKERKARMAASKAGSDSGSKSGATGSGMSDDERAHAIGMVHVCQRILHALTGVMIGAFGVIVLFTTFSTGRFVQITGRGLYFLIRAAAVVSLGAWLVRVLAERRLGRDTNVVSDILRPV